MSCSLHMMSTRDSDNNTEDRLRSERERKDEKAREEEGAVSTIQLEVQTGTYFLATVRVRYILLR